jgi:hypothetical protein
MSSTTETYRMDWEGIALSVRWTPDWLNMTARGYDIAHLELVSVDRVPLPITETGYRSHFTSRALVEGEGGPVSFARKWLDLEAMSSDWKRQVEASKQLALF